MHSSHKFASESSLSSIATATGKRLDQATSKPHFQDGMTQPRGTTCYHIWVKVKRYPRKPPRIPTLSVSFIRSWPAGDATVPPCPKPPTDGHFFPWKRPSCHVTVSAARDQSFSNLKHAEPLRAISCGFAQVVAHSAVVSVVTVLAPSQA